MQDWEGHGQNQWWKVQSVLGEGRHGAVMGKAVDGADGAGLLWGPHGQCIKGLCAAPGTQEMLRMTL